MSGNPFRRIVRPAKSAPEVGKELNNESVKPRPFVDVPSSTRVVTSKAVSTQETFGRVLTALASEPDVGRRIVTTSPDVSVSTNLGGWINKMGVFSAEEQPDYLGEGRLLRWHESPGGQHIELGISEMNLFLMLHALGLGHELHGEHLLPVGTVYDPFVCRGLDALIYGLYNGARFIVAGTPAGITLAPEGGAHQSTITASIGIELPGITLVEPAYARGARLAAVRRSPQPEQNGRRESVPPTLHAPDRPAAVRGSSRTSRLRAASGSGHRWWLPARRTDRTPGGRHRRVRCRRSRGGRGGTRARH